MTQGVRDRRCLAQAAFRDRNRTVIPPSRAVNVDLARPHSGSAWSVAWDEMSGRIAGRGCKLACSLKMRHQYSGGGTGSTLAAGVSVRWREFNENWAVRV